MKTYKKFHTNKLAAAKHLAKIKARGGKTNVTQSIEGTLIEYFFPAKPAKASTPKPANKKSSPRDKPEKQKRYDLLSPDGISIRMRDQPYFKSIGAVKSYFNKWKKRYEEQGYYSSNYGRIDLLDLADECTLEVIE